MHIEPLSPIHVEGDLAGVQAVLHADHQRLDLLFEELLNKVHAGDSVLADEVWTRFERELLAHLGAEEEHILPLLEREDAGEVARVRHEHGQIRTLIARLGIELELHVLREETVETFVGFLRAHAAREDAVLYRWADRALPRGSKASLFERLASARRDLAAVARG